MAELFAVQVGKLAAWNVGDGDRPFRYQATLCSTGSYRFFRIQNYRRGEVSAHGRTGKAVIAAVIACVGRDPRIPPASR